MAAVAIALTRPPPCVPQLNYSIAMFAECLEACKTKSDDAKTSKNSQIREIERELKRVQALPDYSPHPKMDLLKLLLIDHFTPGEEGDGKYDPETSRVLVFCSFRTCIEELLVSLTSPRFQFVSTI